MTCKTALLAAAAQDKPGPCDRQCRIHEIETTGWTAPFKTPDLFGTE